MARYSSPKRARSPSSALSAAKKAKSRRLKPSDEGEVLAHLYAPGQGAVQFLSLGGCGEIGLNCLLYGYDGKWIMVDCGIGFAGQSQPGIDILLPDMSFIRARREHLLGIILTHAHEDHIGAIPYLWEQLGVPIYATAFTAAVLRAKLAEDAPQLDVPIHQVAQNSHRQIGPFGVEFLTLTHSIPEPSALVLHTPLGVIFHSGDWKLDPHPVIGKPVVPTRLMALGQNGVMALVGDSTNAPISGRSGSEGALEESLTAIFSEQKQRIAIACFASNVARLETITRAAIACGRHVALVGRSLWRIVNAAKSCGYLQNLPEFLREEEAGYVPGNKIVLICTGSQGEPRSALARIALDEHPHIGLEMGDVVIFSSRSIPGNEMAIAKVQNGLVAQGITLITSDDALTHVSGHPAQEELIELYGWLRPKLLLPVHGEARHLAAHRKVGEFCQIPNIYVPEDGELLALNNGECETLARVKTQKWAIEGTRLLALDGAELRERRKLGINGGVFISVVLDGRGRLVMPVRISAPGLVGLPLSAAEGERPQDLGAEPLLEQWATMLSQAVEDIPLKIRASEDDPVIEVLRLGMRRHIRALCDKKPSVNVHVLRLG
jgi:ribonuclease J